MSKKLTPKERMALPRNPMPSQEPREAATNFQEVARGYDEKTALAEAERCLNCKTPLCVQGCPVNVPIPGFITALRESRPAEAVKILKSTNNLPAVCGRVCPQEAQCEARCILGKKNTPVAIGRLERYVADWEMTHPPEKPDLPPATGKKVAIIGSGPAGLTCAADLAKLGHQVTIYEALHQAGGVLVYGIPEFRLPKNIVEREINYIKELGVKICFDNVIGRIHTIEELMKAEGYNAVFIGTGAGLPTFLKIPGENLNGVFSANEILTRVNLMKGYLFPEWDTPVKLGRKIIVIGAGNVAMDAARSSLRIANRYCREQGTPAPQVYIVYRRSREEMPAREEEIIHAGEEGVIFNLLTTPVEILGDANNHVTGLKCLKNELGPPDESGRRRPQPVEGSEFVIEADTVIMAIGTRPNPLVFIDTPGLERTPWGTVIADNDAGLTRMKGVWAGGDIVTGAATVISAMGAGKKAAAEIHEYLKG